MTFRIHTYWNVHEGWMLATSPGKSGSNWTLRMCCDVPTKLGTSLGTLGTLGWDHCNTRMMVELGWACEDSVDFCRKVSKSRNVKRLYQPAHRIHGTAIYGNIYHQYTPNIPSHVSIYTSTMDPSWGINLEGRMRCWLHLSYRYSM